MKLPSARRHSQTSRHSSIITTTRHFTIHTILSINVMRRVYICCRVMASLFRRGVMTHQKIHAPFLRFFPLFNIDSHSIR